MSHDDKNTPDKLVIRVYPDHGHPSSLWPSRKLVLIDRPRQPFVLPGAPRPGHICITELNNF